MGTRASTHTHTPLSPLTCFRQPVPSSSRTRSCPCTHPADPSCLGLCPWPLPDSLRSVYRPSHQIVPNPVVLNTAEDTHTPCPALSPVLCLHSSSERCGVECPSSGTEVRLFDSAVTSGPAARPGISRPTVDLLLRNAPRVQPNSSDSASHREDAKLQTLSAKGGERRVVDPLTEEKKLQWNLLKKQVFIIGFSLHLMHV